MSFDVKVILSAGKCFPNVFNIYEMLRSMLFGKEGCEKNSANVFGILDIVDEF